VIVVTGSESPGVIELLCLALTAAGTVFFYLWRRSERARDDTIKSQGVEIDALKEALADYRLHVAEHYVTVSEMSKALVDLTESIKGIYARFDALRDLLDRKADK
jgi:NAD(P)-dependent dehydrogenase (short-subunit alcohol dehydrogenase family)